MTSRFVMIVLKHLEKEGVREAYDIVMARAVARLSVLSELCLPLVKVGGTFIAMKGAAANEEIENGKYALEVLGGDLKEMSTFQLPFEESERNILLIEKSARHQRNIHANREHPINYLLKNKSY